ncbi:MAG: hypothetical protein EOM15_15770 [Spirochaetia bacterium]|nr:hypothetical protein [Spirochaetia bacterium]
MRLKRKKRDQETELSETLGHWLSEIKSHISESEQLMDSLEAKGEVLAQRIDMLQRWHASQTVSMNRLSYQMESDRLEKQQRLLEDEQEQVHQILQQFSELSLLVEHAIRSKPLITTESSIQVLQGALDEISIQSRRSQASLSALLN